MIERVTVLGSGTILPSPGHGCSGYLLQGDQAPVLLDCGPGVLYRLAEANISPDTLELILISHFHLDHVSDLAAILNARSLLLDSVHPAPLSIIGPKGLSAYFQWLAKQMDPWFETSVLQLIEGEEIDRISHELRIQTFPTGHTKNSICYRMTDKFGGTIFYSGDTDYNERLLPFARNVDLALFECSTPDELKLHGHLTPRLAAQLAAKADVRQLLLTHFYREILGHDILGAARAVYSGPIYLAEDGSSYSLARKP